MPAVLAFFNTSPAELIILLCPGFFGLAFTIWFIWTMSQMRQDMGRIATYIRWLAIVHQPTKEQAKLINRSVKPVEVVNLLNRMGVKLSIQRNDKGFRTVHAENAETADPELLQLLRDHEDEVLLIFQEAEARRNNPAQSHQ